MRAWYLRHQFNSSIMVPDLTLELAKQFNVLFFRVVGTFKYWSFHINKTTLFQYNKFL
jgi:hypothetical protein